MIVVASMDRMGNVLLEPKSEKAQKAYERHMKEMTGRARASVYLQGDRIYDIQEYMPPAKWRDLDQGWTVSFKMDPWVYGHLLGYDAHNVGW